MKANQNEPKPWLAQKMGIYQRIREARRSMTSWNARSAT